MRPSIAGIEEDVEADDEGGILHKGQAGAKGVQRVKEAKGGKKRGKSEKLRRC